MSRLMVAFVLVIATQLAGSTAVSAAPTDCQGRWFWGHNLDMPQGAWSEGVHFYVVRGKLDGIVNFTPDFVGFQVTPNAPLYRGQAHLRFYDILVLSDGAMASTGGFLNPAQDTDFQVYDDLIGTKREADAFAARETMEVSWDGGPWVEMRRGPAVSFCSFDVLRVGTWERQYGPGYRP